MSPFLCQPSTGTAIVHRAVVALDRAGARGSFGYVQVFVTKPRGQSAAFTLLPHRGGAALCSSDHITFLEPHGGEQRKDGPLGAVPEFRRTSSASAPLPATCAERSTWRTLVSVNRVPLPKVQLAFGRQW
jgi:hypothetical protein